VGRARHPPGRLGGQRRAHDLPVVQRLARQRGADGGQPGLVAEQLAHRDALLAGGGEFRPVAGHRRIQLQLAFADQLQGGDGGEGLGTGEQVQQGVLLPHFLAIPIRRAGPQVDHRLTGDLHAEGGAPLAGVVEQGGEGVAHRFETQVEETVDPHAGSWRRWGSADCRRWWPWPASAWRPDCAPTFGGYSSASPAGGSQRRSRRRLARRTASTKPPNGTSVMATSPTWPFSPSSRRPVTGWSRYWNQCSPTIIGASSARSRKCA